MTFLFPPLRRSSTFSLKKWIQNITRIIIFNVQNGVERTKIIIFNVQNGVERTKIIIFNVQNGVERTKIIIFNVQNGAEFFYI